jgi:hypothetical protein
MASIPPPRGIHALLAVFPNADSYRRNAFSAGKRTIAIPQMKRADCSPGMLLTIGALIGLGVKASMLFYKGGRDMDAYYEWGQRALELGLPKSYQGIYFPLQYQIFELCAWIVQLLNVPFFTIFTRIEHSVRSRFVLSPDSSTETARLESALRLILRICSTPNVTGLDGLIAGV